MGILERLKAIEKALPTPAQMATLKYSDGSEKRVTVHEAAMEALRRAAGGRGDPYIVGADDPGGFVMALLSNRPVDGVFST